MKTLQTLSGWAFLVLALVHIGAEIGHMPTLSTQTKPWLMPLLALWFWCATPGKGRFLRQSISIGLVFATVGDILLLFSRGTHSDFFFLLGLLAFLITQISYMGGFWVEVGRAKGFLHSSPFSGAAIVAFLVGFLYWLLPGVPEGLRLPVIIYGTALAGMVLAVLHARLRLGEVAFAQVMAGAMLFLLSDSLLAAARFGHSFPYSGAAIMTTYLLGQGLIAHGTALYLKTRKKRKTAGA